MNTDPSVWISISLSSLQQGISLYFLSILLKFLEPQSILSLYFRGRSYETSHLQSRIFASLIFVSTFFDFESDKEDLVTRLRPLYRVSPSSLVVE